MFFILFQLKGSRYPQIMLFTTLEKADEFIKESHVQVLQQPQKCHNKQCFTLAP